ncbi:hypothetical protein [Rhodoligotrophos defluvii]|uniref:hypothetical protein n=1 Tax=Rhodoligotrophos defluvii TaxID=2561934 RepID=UPI0010C9C06C|nr:hypothetical protein [Rhodoligotrophos defluvii]
MHALKVLFDTYILDRVIPSELCPPRLYGPSLANEEYTRNHWYDFTSSQRVSHLKELGWGSPDHSSRIRQAFSFLDTVPEAPGGIRPADEHLAERTTLARANWDQLKLKEQLGFLDALHEIYGHDELHRFVQGVAPDAYPYHAPAADLLHTY